MASFDKILPKFKNGVKIRRGDWGRFTYIQNVNNEIVTSMGNKYIINMFDLMSNSWEIYKEPEYDWDSIIRNENLCQFWNDKKTESIFGFLTRINEAKKQFFNEEGICYKNCRPVHKTEITFYENKGKN